jgi:hypothetical protein
MTAASGRRVLSGAAHVNCCKFQDAFAKYIPQNFQRPSSIFWAKPLLDFCTRCFRYRRTDKKMGEVWRKGVVGCGVAAGKFQRSQRNLVLSYMAHNGLGVCEIEIIVVVLGLTGSSVQ